MSIKTVVFIGAILLPALTQNTFAVDPPAFTVSTAVGFGADAQLNEHNNNGVSTGSGGDLNTRTSANGDRNEIVALRFDLSEHTLSSLAEVTLNIVNFRDNTTRQVALYGVKQGTIGGTGFFSTEDWDENLLAEFGDMPGLTVTDGDFITQNIDFEQVTFLGQITFENLQKGTVETFSDPALTTFIRSYTGSPYVTFLLAAPPAYTSTGQARFASKEAVALENGEPAGNAGDFAPYLSFVTGGGSVPPGVLISKPANGADFGLDEPIEIEATVTADNAITSVQFYAGIEEAFELLGEDTTEPYSFTFNPTIAGTYTIQVVAFDNQGLTGEHSVTVDVGVTIPPVVNITTPAEDAILLRGTPIIIAATASDDVSVAKVEFFVGTSEPLTLLGEDTTAPYTMEFTPSTSGAYTIQAVATDNLGLASEAFVFVTVEEPAANLRTVSTAVGEGADAQANEHSDSISGGGSDLNTRTSMNGDRNEIVALRFDLSEYTLAELSEVTLNIINFRNNSARQVALYGVHQGTMGGTGIYSTEDWMESGLLDFGDIPGLEITDGDFLTQSIDFTKVTPLGQITFSGLTKGTVETFNDPALTDFVRAYTGSKLITFLLAAAPDYTSTGQARFASKEALALEGDTPSEEPGRYAPYLTFQAGGAVAELRIAAITRAGDQLTLEWSGGNGPFTVQRTISITPAAWTDVTAGINETSATVTIEGASGFFRVAGQ